MPRPLLDEAHRTDAVNEAISKMHPEILDEVREAIAKNDVVVVGMFGNMNVGRARGALEKAGIPFKYIGYGGYMSEWRKRLVIKMWSGWPTYPQVFVKGVLIGGADETQAAIADGSLKKRLEASSGAV
ncbi:MAG: Glutaredoxin-related protein [Myxococcaceae bacterium]|jgi:monothiol glutaredoxin|nr:Glutaredoxin-related protein [Myxococcaceae bacterium]